MTDLALPTNIHELRDLFGQPLFFDQPEEYFTRLAQCISLFDDKEKENELTYFDIAYLLHTEHSKVLEQGLSKIKDKEDLPEELVDLLSQPSHNDLSSLPKPLRDKLFLTLVQSLSEEQLFTTLSESVLNFLPNLSKFLLEKVELNDEFRDHLLFHLTHRLTIDKKSLPKEQWDNAVEVVHAVFEASTSFLENKHIMSALAKDAVDFRLETLSHRFKPEVAHQCLVEMVIKNKFSPDSNQEKIKPAVEFLYHQCKELMLNFSDEQLNLFIPRQNHEAFWDVHNRHRLRQDIQNEVGYNPLQASPKRKI